MIKYKEFAPYTYLNLENGEILVTVMGVLKLIVKNSISFTDIIKNWEIGQLKAFLKQNSINITEVDRKECLLAKNTKNKVIDESSDDENTLLLLQSISILKLIKILQQDNPLVLRRNKKYKEVMFEGFYLELGSGQFFFKCENVVDSFLNKPYSRQSVHPNLSYRNFDQLITKKPNFGMRVINTKEIELAEISKSNVSNELDSYVDNKSDYEPININDATKTNIKVISSTGLLELDKIISSIEEKPNKKSYQKYKEDGPGTISENKPFGNQLFSLQKVIEEIQSNNSKVHIEITEKAVKKQMNELIDSKPDVYKKKVIADNDIAQSGRQRFGLMKKGVHVETYVNEALLDALLEYYYSKNTSNYPKPEWQLGYSIPLLSDLLQITADTENSTEVNITINDINAVNKKFTRFKSKTSNCIKQETSKLTEINEKIKAKITADINLRYKIKSCWKEDNENYLLWQEIDKLNNEPESVFAGLIKMASCESNSIYDIWLQDVAGSSGKVENEIELLKLIYQIQTVIEEINPICSEFEDINFKSIVWDKLNEINALYVQTIKAEDRKVDYQDGVKIPEKAIKEVDKTIVTQVNRPIERIITYINSVTEAQKKLDEVIRSIQLDWEDMKEELEYFDFNQISDQNRSQAKRIVNELLSKVKMGLQL